MAMFSVRPFESRTLSWWSDERINLDLSPPYQRRGHIWTNEDKAFLIDSILNGYDIPKIYIADFTYISSNLNSAKKPFAVIDGRQRFEAFFDFFDDRFALSDKFIFLEDATIKINSLTYSQLKSKHPRIASKFENFNLNVMSVITDDAARINDLFVRLNRSKPLSGAEVRNAMAGSIPNLIRRIADHPFFRSKASFNSTRKQDQNTAAKFLLLEHRGALVDTKKINLDRFVKDGIDTESTAFDAATERVIKVLDQVTPCFNDRDPALKLATGLPVFYWYFRNNKVTSDTADKIREFETARRANKKTASSGKTATIDKELQQYDYFNRSPDDATSHERRYQILLDRIK